MLGPSEPTKFAHNAKLGETVDTLEARAAIQRDPTG